MKAKKTLWHGILFAVFAISLIFGNLMMFTPTAMAAQTSSITAANFLATDAKKYLVLHFSEPVCADPDCTLDLDMGNFEYYDGSGDGFTTISDINHTVGTDWVQITMDVASTANDVNDKIKVKDVYTASGMLIGDPSSGGGGHSAWVSLTQDTTAPTITTKGIVKDGTKDILLLGFSEPVCDELGGILDYASDFTYGDDNAGNASALDAGIASTDQRWFTLSTDNPIVAADAVDATDDYITIVDNKFYDLVGNEIAAPAPGSQIDLSTFSVDGTSPTIEGAYGQLGNNTDGGNDLLRVKYDEPVFSATNGTGNLTVADFTYNGSESITAVTHTAGSDSVLMDLSANPTSFNTIQAADATSVYDAFGNAATTAQTTPDDNTHPVIRAVWVNQFIDRGDSACTAIGGGTCSIVQVTNEDGERPNEDGLMMKWSDGALVAGTDGMIKDLGETIYDTTNGVAEYTQVKFYIYYEDDDGSVNFTDDDDLAFVINDGANFTTAAEWNITADINEKAWTEITVDLTSSPDAGTALASQTNPRYFGIKVNGTTQFANDDNIYLDNIRFSRGAASKSNQIVLVYSESVDASGDPAEGATQASTSTFGDMTTNKTIAGLGAFASGTLTTKTGTNNVTKSADGKRYKIELASLTGGLITQASPLTVSGLFTPTANVTDIDGNTIETGSTHTPEAIIDTLDLTSAANGVSEFKINRQAEGGFDLGWTTPSQTAATFSHYAVLYDTSSGVSVASSVFDESDDSALATPTTSITSLTGLTDGTSYYVNLVGVDTKGNASTLATEQSGTPGSGGGGGDDVGPKAATSFTASVDENMRVILTWTDPTDSDLNKIQIIRSKGADVTPSTLLAQVIASPSNGTAETYTDEDVAEGEIVNYYLRGVDDNGNFGTETETISLTVERGAEEVADDVAESTAEEETASEETTTAEEETVAPEEVSFSDIKKHWAETEILAMGSVGIVHGNPDGSFNPDGKLNRAEGAVILYRLLGLEEPTVPSKDPFTDVPADIWFSGYVSDMKALDMIHGYGDGTYGPDNDLTRAQFVKLAVEVYYYLAEDDVKAILDGWMAGKPTTAYSDLANDWYTPYVTIAANMGFIHGYECGDTRCFGAENSITRAEATVILYNMFESELF